MKLLNTPALLGLGLVLALTACGAENTAQPTVTSTAAATESDDASATPAAAAPASGHVIEVTATTDGSGVNKFEPNTITAKKGDVIRVKLGQGVHDFHIVEGPSGVTLPPATEYLQIPGQTVDVPVALPAGTYTFQCDPHAALGMKGTLTVQD
ncbi:MAG TPA: plastocyanin/azurin family copper-binding protein [Longimicrobiaceae bacterium]|nr:plastocyanin/azurin family copper-binding protein [Longimicrobiaceae bacterium]